MEALRDPEAKYGGRATKPGLGRQAPAPTDVPLPAHPVLQGAESCPSVVPGLGFHDCCLLNQATYSPPKN